MSDTCPVCYNDLTIKNVMNLKCNHQLCRNCYYNWTDEQGKNTCPCCRDILYKKGISERLIQVMKLKYQLQDLEYKKDDMQLTVDGLREDRDYLIHESVEYNKRVKLIKEKKRELENDLDCIEYDIYEKKNYASKINVHLLPKNKTTDLFELAKHFRGVAKKLDKRYDNETKEHYTTVVKSFNYISKKNNKNIKKILKKSVKAKIKVKGKRKKVYEEEDPNEDMCIYELFKNDIEEYEEYEDIDWTFDSNVFSDSDISEMPELEDVETTFSEDELEYDRAALNVSRFPMLEEGEIYERHHHIPPNNTPLLPNTLMAIDHWREYSI